VSWGCALYVLRMQCGEKETVWMMLKVLTKFTATANKLIKYRSLYTKNHGICQHHVEKEVVARRTPGCESKMESNYVELKKFA
jgi:hypothetical protein